MAVGRCKYLSLYGKVILMAWGCPGYTLLSDDTHGIVRYLTIVNIWKYQSLALILNSMLIDAGLLIPVTKRVHWSFLSRMHFDNSSMHSPNGTYMPSKIIMYFADIYSHAVIINAISATLSQFIINLYLCLCDKWLLVM